MNIWGSVNGVIGGLMGNSSNYTVIGNPCLGNAMGGQFGQYIGSALSYQWTAQNTAWAPAQPSPRDRAYEKLDVIMEGIYKHLMKSRDPVDKELFDTLETIVYGEPLEPVVHLAKRAAMRKEPVP